MNLTTYGVSLQAKPADGTNGETPAKANQSPASIADLLARRAGLDEHRAALIHEGRTVSYGQLIGQVLFLAAKLKENGVQRGDRVALCFPNHPHFVAAFFAASTIGATVVPINPLLKAEEIAHILADSGSKAILVHERIASEAFKAVGEKLQGTLILRFCYSSVDQQSQVGNCLDLRLDQIEFQSSSQSQQLVPHPVDLEEDLAVLVYTSGTTGKPKGAMLSQRNLLAGVRIAHTHLRVTQEDRVLAVLPLCHIYGLTAVMLAMIAQGGTLVILEKFDPLLALRSIEEHQVTILPAVPTMYQFLLMESEKEPHDLSSLRLCLSGAAPLPVALLKQLEEAFEIPIVEGYGLTEVSCIATVNPLDGMRKVGSVGPGFPGVEIGIFSQDAKILPGGAENVGEVGIRGPNVMKGYYKKPEATAECMVGDWFLTGDLGYLDQDSYLYIVGRTKELIIRGGQNIYPREVEEVIQRMPQVQEVAVVGVPDQYMGERVKAFVVLREGCQLSQEDVKSYCCQCLAEYKVPRLVEFIAALPRNSTGKVLKRVLLAG